jgi:hypothetical protein
MVVRRSTSQTQAVIAQSDSLLPSADREEKIISTASGDYVPIIYEPDNNAVVSIESLYLTPEDALYDFVKNEGLPEDTMDKISEVIHEIDTFLESKNTIHEIHKGIFIDREEPTTKEIELTIRAKGDLAYIYENLKSPIYDIVIKTFPVETLKKILINFEPL